MIGDAKYQTLVQSCQTQSILQAPKAIKTFFPTPSNALIHYVCKHYVLYNYVYLRILLNSVLYLGQEVLHEKILLLK